VTWRTLSPVVTAGRHGLAAIGRLVRLKASFLLMLAALFWGVLLEARRPGSWRRPVRLEFRRALHQAAGGGMATTLVTAGLTGLALVAQAIYWLGLAGQQELEGSLIVTVLVRELTPLLTGMVLLGRSGTVTVTELGLLRLGGQMDVIAAQGVDPFLLLVLPRTLAFALTSFTLGVFFVLGALVMGFIASSLLGAVRESLWMFFDHVLSSMRAADFVMFPVKMLSIGALVALTACMTGLTADPGDDAATLLPRGFVRGVLAIMLASLAFSLAA
jgi:phospholipid/cholesterol/gamma-HCH transport system permease protein